MAVHTTGRAVADNGHEGYRDGGWAAEKAAAGIAHRTVVVVGVGDGVIIIRMLRMVIGGMSTS